MAFSSDIFLLLLPHHGLLPRAEAPKVEIELELQVGDALWVLVLVVD